MRFTILLGLLGIASAAAPGEGCANASDCDVPNSQCEMDDDGYDKCFCPDGSFNCGSNEPGTIGPNAACYEAADCKVDGSTCEADDNGDDVCTSPENAIGGSCQVDDSRWEHTCDRWNAKCESDVCVCPDSSLDCAGERGPPEPPMVDEDTGMECSMDGYVGLVQKLMNVALAGLSILRQIGSSFLPHDLRKAVEYAW